MIKKILLNLLIICVGLLVWYKIGLNKTNKTKEDYKEAIIKETLENNPIPMCNEGNCPKYQTFDVDEDGKSENIITEYLGMSQFAGRVLVVDDGRATFISKGETFINVRPIKEYENENGFIIDYSTVANAQSNKDIEHAYYKYIDGNYILEKIEKETN